MSAFPDINEFFSSVVEYCQNEKWPLITISVVVVFALYYVYHVPGRIGRH